MSLSCAVKILLFTDVSLVKTLGSPWLLQSSPLLWLHNPLQIKYLDMLLYAFLENLRLFSEVFNLRKFSLNRKRLSCLRRTLGEFQEIFEKSPEIFGKPSK